jgi:hypothetical protein
VQASVQPDKRVVITGKTNLPADTQLTVSVSDALWNVQEESADITPSSDNTFASKPLGPFEDGWYIANVSIGLLFFQPEHIQRIVGRDGNNLKGPLVKKPLNNRVARSRGPEVKVEARFRVGGQDAAQLQVARLKKELKQQKALKSKIENLYSRLEIIKRERLLEYTATYSNRQIENTHNEFEDALRAVRESATDETLGKLYVLTPLLDITAMWTSIKDETAYRDERMLYLDDLKVLKELIQTREAALSPNALRAHAEPTPNEIHENAMRSSKATELFRQWTSSTGRFSTEAKISGFTNGIVTLENREGKKIKVSEDKLSKADREFVEKWAGEQH